MILDENQKRWKLAYELRQAGKTYNLIGKDLGVTGTQAVNLCKRYERLLANLDEYNREYIPRGKGAVAVRAFQKQFRVWTREDIIAKLKSLPEDSHWHVTKMNRNNYATVKSFRLHEWAGLIDKKTMKGRPKTLDYAVGFLRRYGYTVIPPDLP